MELDEDWMDEGSGMAHDAWTISKEDYLKPNVAYYILSYQKKHGICPKHWQTYPETRPYPLKSCSLCGLGCAYHPNSRVPASRCHMGQVTREDENQTTLGQIRWEMKFTNQRGRI